MSKGAGKADSTLSGLNGRNVQRGQLSIKEKSLGHASRSSNSNTGTIANLSNQEKEKVSRLVQRLVTLGQEHEEALSALNEEKNTYVEGTARLQRVMEEQLLTITEKLKCKDDEIRELQSKCSLSIGLLALYQAKLKNSADMFRFYELSANDNKSKINQLESDTLSLQTLVASQKLAIESFESSRARHATAQQVLQSQCETAEVRFKAELSALTDKLMHRDMQVNELKKQLEQSKQFRAVGGGFTVDSTKPSQPPDVMEKNTDVEFVRDSITKQAGEFNSTQLLDGNINVSLQPELIHSALSNPLASATDHDMYGAMYSSIDTSAISFSSSHIADSQHGLNVPESGVGAGMTGEDELTFGTKQPLSQNIQNTYGFDLKSNIQKHMNSSSGSLITGNEGVRSTLDPTPMKRKPSSAVVKTNTSQLELQANGALGSRLKSDIISLRSRTPVYDPMWPNVEERADADHTTPVNLISANLTPASKEKKKKKDETNRKSPRHGDRAKDVTVKKRGKVPKDSFASKNNKAAAAPATAHRHHTFSAVSATTASYDAAVLRNAPTSEPKSNVAPKVMNITKPASSSTRVREQSINYDDSLFDLLSEMDRT